MKVAAKRRSGGPRSGRVVRAMVAVLVLGAGSLLAFRYIGGGHLGLWRYVSLARAVLDSGSVTGDSHGSFTNVVFLHHSVGQNLIDQGGVREALTAAGYSFWDHGYNWHTQGLRGPDGALRGYSYNVPDDNTDPDGLARIFAQPVYRLPVNALSGLMQHEVIVFKSCFPVSNIASDAQLEAYKGYYLAMRDTMDRHPEKLFILLTPPTVNPAETNAENAARARAFASWLQSDSYVQGHRNIAVLNLFGYLAEDDPTAPDYNMLRAEYRDGSDSHPNQLANQTIGPLLADYIVTTAQSYAAAYQPGHADAAVGQAGQ